MDSTTWWMNSAPTGSIAATSKPDISARVWSIAGPWLQAPHFRTVWPR